MKSLAKLFSTWLAPLAALAATLYAVPAWARTPDEPKSEMHLVLPDFSQVSFHGMSGGNLLMIGLIVCALGLGFGVFIYNQLRKLPVHRSMREISELIYETCKTYLITQGKFILILEVFIGIII